MALEPRAALELGVVQMGAAYAVKRLEGVNLRAFRALPSALCCPHLLRLNVSVPALEMMLKLLTSPL